MTDHVPLPTLLSQVLVAFTIEHDNQSERRIAESGAPRRFLVSLVMWSNLMRFVGDAGVRVGDIPARAGFPGTPVTTGWIHSVLGGMERWGYVTIARDPADSRPKPPRADWIVRATPAGKAAQDIWRPLAGDIEERWRTRFGDHDIGTLRTALCGVVNRLDIELPHYLPIAGYGLRTLVPHLDDWVPVAPDALGADSDLDLAVLLARVLLLFTIEFERDSELSLAMSANALRVLDDDGVRVRDLPGRTGVSKEAIAVSAGFLERHGYAVIEPDPNAARTKRVRLTANGRTAHDAYRRRVEEVEARWRARFGPDAIEQLRAALERLFDRADGDAPRLAQGLEPSPTGWRNHKQYRAQTEAMQRDPAAALPHHPMVLHRGGWPDGS